MISPPDPKPSNRQPEDPRLDAKQPSPATPATSADTEPVPVNPSTASQSLASASAGILELLRTRKPRTREVSSELHPNPPCVPKKAFTELGDLIKTAERHTTPRIAGDRWISLRLDGKNFGRYVRRLQKKGVFKTINGYSEEFAAIMQECVQALMGSTSAAYGYTQSDEMTVLIPPASVVRGIQNPHIYNGRVQKIGTLAASEVTGLFNFRVTGLEIEHKNPLDSKKVYSGMLGRFDCRVGSYKTKDEAMSLILWRAYDCGVNGVSDAVHKANDLIPSSSEDTKTENVTRKQAVRFDTSKKLSWLADRKMLPLPSHQASGSYYVRVIREREAFNPQLKKTVTCMRSVVEKVEGELLTLASESKLYPRGDAQSSNK